MTDLETYSPGCVPATAERPQAEWVGIQIARIIASTRGPALDKTDYELVVSAFWQTLRGLPKDAIAAAADRWLMTEAWRPPPKDLHDLARSFVERPVLRVISDGAIYGPAVKQDQITLERAREIAAGDMDNPIIAGMLRNVGQDGEANG